jgi:hypothetical protein
MEVFLLYVASFSLERVVPAFPVDQHVSGHNTHSNSVSENVEQCGFTSSRCTLALISLVQL